MGGSATHTRAGENELAGKRILLTHALSGNGPAIASALTAAGASVLAQVALADHSPAPLVNPPYRLISATMDTPEAARALWQEVEHEVIDVVVLNCASMKRASVTDSVRDWDAAWDCMWSSNVVGPSALIKAALPHFIKNGGGVVITVSACSSNISQLESDQYAYGGSIAAIESVTKTVARNYAAANILAHNVAPDHHTTATTPDQVGLLTVFLATGKARHLSGATFDMNSGTFIR
jgi:NAD(P)-dependent dehydrogenase (short-subunit alcohol dehydrogenase family)